MKYWSFKDKYPNDESEFPFQSHSDIKHSYYTEHILVTFMPIENN